jgi:hypothetical protein
MSQHLPRSLILELDRVPTADDWPVVRNWSLVLDRTTGNVYRKVNGAPVALGGGEGTPGMSAYAVAVANGFAGTEAEWLLSLEGADSTVPGPKGDKGDPGTTDYSALINKPTLGDAAAKNVGTGAGDVAAGNHTHVGGGGPDVKSGLVSLTAGGSVNVSFVAPFASVPQVVVTSQINNADTSCTYSAHSVTVNGFTLRGAGNPAGNVAWIATTAGNT